jgi:hypothetical protein
MIKKMYNQNMKRKYILLVLLFFLFSCNKNNGKNIEISEYSESKNITHNNIVNEKSVIEWIFETNYVRMIRPDNENKYVGTFFVRDNKIHFIYESDAGFSPSIFAYKNEFNSFKLVIKSRWVGFEYADIDMNFFWVGDIDGKIPSYYYLIEFTREDSDIKYSCKILEEVNINGFSINYGKVNDDNVNLRENPSLDNKIINRINSNEIVRVLDISEETMEIDNMIDYWFKIEHENIEAWIYGYYLDFLKEIEKI